MPNNASISRMSHDDLRGLIGSQQRRMMMAFSEGGFWTSFTRFVTMAGILNTSVRQCAYMGLHRGAQMLALRKTKTVLGLFGSYRKLLHSYLCGFGKINFCT